MYAAAKKQEYRKGKDTSRYGSYLHTGNALNLKKKSLVFFTLTILLTLIMAAGVLYESMNNRMHIIPSEGNSEIFVHANKCNSTPDSNGSAGFSSAFLTGSLTLLLCTLIGGMFFFMRNIMIPLEITGEIVHRMTEGHLDKPIQVKAGNEIGQVAEGINGLAINMQEVLLNIWNHTQQNFILLDRISEQLNSQPDSALPLSQLKKDIARVRQENEGMKDIVTTFDYFEVKLEHEKMVSDPLYDTIKSKA